VAWTAPRTYVTNEIVTSSILNTDHRDNLLFLYGMRRELLAETIVSSAVSNVTWSSIPATYRELHVVFNGVKSDQASAQTLYMRFNGDSGANYGNAQQGFRNEIPVANIGGTNIVAAYTAGGEVRIPYYSMPNIYISALVNSLGRVGNAGVAGDMGWISYPTAWQAGASGVTSIALLTLTGNIAGNSSKFALYGIT